MFATHDVAARGAGLTALLTDLAAQRLIGLEERGRGERFGGAVAGWVRELTVRRVERDSL